MEQKKALLVMDMQKGILQNLPQAESFVPHVAKAIDKARKNHIPVIYVVLSFRPGLPEINDNNRRFSAYRERLTGVNMDIFSQIHEAIAPQPEDVVTTKKRVSAFTGSDLELVLRSRGITHLILTGIATSGIVLSTFCEAADKDYSLTVLSDACADGDEEMHRVLTTKYFPRQADVVSVDEWS